MLFSNACKGGRLLRAEAPKMRWCKKINTQMDISVGLKPPKRDDAKIVVDVDVSRILKILLNFLKETF